MTGSHVDVGAVYWFSQENDDSHHQFQLKSKVSAVIKATTSIKSATYSSKTEEKKTKYPAILTEEASLIIQEAAVLAEPSSKV